LIKKQNKLIKVVKEDFKVNDSKSDSEELCEEENLTDTDFSDDGEEERYRKFNVTKCKIYDFLIL
jgi:hypothetical protein